MRAVFDLDDTICVHKNRDYVNAEPIIPTIEKMRLMKKEGWEIVIYTARGQVSCKGDITEIERRNRSVVEEWLKRNDVPYDTLLFGKPLGDLYVDDKGFSLTDFLQQPFCVLHGGGSGKQIYRFGNIVKKDLGTAEETAEFKKWVETNNGEFDFPKIISYVYNSVYMEYIDGKRGCDIDADFVPGLVEKIVNCKRTSPQPFNIKPHIERLQKNRTGNQEADRLLESVSQFLLRSQDKLCHEGSFCHGDLILSNMIIQDGKIYLVDARNTDGANSYLLDLAKLRMSLRGYEKIFGISPVDNTKWSLVVDDAARDLRMIKETIALEIMFIFRCYRYKNDQDKKKLIEFALEEAKEW